MIHANRLDNRCPEKLPTGLILAGPNIAGHEKLFDQLAARVAVENVGPVVILRSGHASNLKTVLKQLIKSATSRKEGFDEDDLFSDQTKVWQWSSTMTYANSQQGPKLLNYDLQILHDYILTNNLKNIVVGFQDSEAFDGNLLADLVALF